MEEFGQCIISLTNSSVDESQPTKRQGNFLVRNRLKPVRMGENY